MVEPQLDQDSEAAQSRMESARAAMEPLKAEFLEATVDRVTIWLWDETESVVEKHPGILRELGTPKLRELKEDIQRLADRLPRLVDEHVGDPDLWVHEADDLLAALGVEASGYYSNPYRSESTSAPILLMRPVRRLLGDLGQLLRKWGMDDPRWRRIGERGYLKMKYHQEYKHAFRFSDGMLESLERYASAADDLWMATNELNEAETARNSAEAAEAWDQA